MPLPPRKESPPRRLALPAAQKWVFDAKAKVKALLDRKPSLAHSKTPRNSSTPSALSNLATAPQRVSVLPSFYSPVSSPQHDPNSSTLPQEPTPDDHDLSMEWTAEAGLADHLSSEDRSLETTRSEFRNIEDLAFEDVDTLGNLAYTLHCAGEPMTCGYKSVDIIAYLLNFYYSAGETDAALSSNFYHRIFCFHRVTSRHLGPYAFLEHMFTTLLPHFEHWLDYDALIASLNAAETRDTADYEAQARRHRGVKDSNAKSQEHPAERYKYRRWMAYYWVQYHVHFPFMYGIFEALRNSAFLLRFVHDLAKYANHGRNDSVKKLKDHWADVMRVGDFSRFTEPFQRTPTLRGLSGTEYAAHCLPPNVQSNFWKDPDGYCAKFKSGRLRLTSINFPSFMYNLKLFNEGLVDESIFDSMYIENGMRLKAHGSSHIRDDVYCVPGTLTHTMGINRVSREFLFQTIWEIFYVSAGLNRLATEFYGLDLFKFMQALEDMARSLGPSKMQQILDRYTRRVYGTRHQLTIAKPEEDDYETIPDAMQLHNNAWRARMEEDSTVVRNQAANTDLDEGGDEQPSPNYDFDDDVTQDVVPFGPDADVPKSIENSPLPKPRRSPVRADAQTVPSASPRHTQIANRSATNLHTLAIVATSFPPSPSPLFQPRRSLKSQPLSSSPLIRKHHFRPATSSTPFIFKNSKPLDDDHFSMMDVDETPVALPRRLFAATIAKQSTQRDIAHARTRALVAQGVLVDQVNAKLQFPAFVFTRVADALRESATASMKRKQAPTRDMDEMFSPIKRRR